MRFAPTVVDCKTWDERLRREFTDDSFKLRGSVIVTTVATPSDGGCPWIDLLWTGAIDSDAHQPCMKYIM
jgi:hypothetical protein